MFTTDADGRMWMKLTTTNMFKRIPSQEVCKFLAGAQRVGRGNTHSNACYSATRNPDRWLFGEAGKEILLPFPAEAMKIRAVSRRVNKPEDNDPRLLEEGEMEEVGRLI